MRRVRTLISPVERSDPSVKDARKPRLSLDLSRRGIRGHGSEQDNHARSEGRRPLCDEGGWRRRLIADMICDDDRTPDALPVEELSGWGDGLPVQGKASPGYCDRPCGPHVPRKRAWVSPVERPQGSGTRGPDKARAHRWKNRRCEKLGLRRYIRRQRRHEARWRRSDQRCSLKRNLEPRMAPIKLEGHCEKLTSHEESALDTTRCGK